MQGSEAAGEVIEIGSSVKDRKVGDAVIVLLAPHCFAEEVVVGIASCSPLTLLSLSLSLSFSLSLSLAPYLTSSARLASSIVTTEEM